MRKGVILRWFKSPKVINYPLLRLWTVSHYVVKRRPSAKQEVGIFHNEVPFASLRGVCFNSSLVSDPEDFNPTY